jgi:lysophospholipase L1-like esterase
MASLLADMQTANQLPGDANGSQLVFVGDDLTAGGPGVAAAVGRCYPWHLCQRYGGTVKPLLVATPGYTVVQQQALVTQQVVPLDRVPFACNVAVVCAGTNDLAAGTAAASVSAGVATLCSSLRSAGFAVAVATITPRSAATAALQITLSAAIDAVNSDIRSGYTAYADALVDWANDPRLADYTDVTWFAADGCHTTDAGDAVKAELVKTAVDPLLVAPTAPLSFASFYPVNRTFAGRYGNFPRA